MNMEQRGMYMTLLCLQHQQGHLSEEDMLDVCGKKDRKVFSKFKLDDDGLYYNERMDIELKKRKEYSQSRSENGKKGGRPKKQNESKTEANENHGHYCSRSAILAEKLFLRYPSSFSLPLPNYTELNGRAKL
jgi:uncharacterized protein YdaU (DUF1376 family)